MIDIVVDVGNSRIKWGRVTGGKIVASVSLPHGDRAAWEGRLAEWGLAGPLHWVLSGVRPQSLADLLHWLESRGDTARILARAAELPLVVKVPEPDKVGIDRLLAAVGANARRAAGTRAREGAVVVGVGTAITVDLIDPEGAWLGGAIMPGPRLLAVALHQHTALLPLVEDLPLRPEAPATDTPAAIALGIHWTMAGGINGLVAELGQRLARRPEEVPVYVTGGAAPLVLHRLIGRVGHCPELVLEGICLAAGSAS